MGEPSLEIDQDLAKRLLIDGATFVVLDVPEGTEFGIDMKSWNTGEKFKGMKMIPPGLHFIYYSSVGDEGDVGPRVGFLHNFKKSEFLVKKWDPETEDISLKDPDKEEVEVYRRNILNLDKHLGPYPFDVWKKWKRLSEKVTEKLAARLVPESGYVRSALELVACERPAAGVPGERQRRRRSRVSTPEEKEEELLPQLQPCPGTQLRLSPFPERSYPEGASPAEITQHSLDSSYMLETMLALHDSPVDLIGELQFSFLCFLVGHSLDAFEHWKKLVGLLCACDSAIPKYREVYSEFIGALDAQLVEIPEDFLVDIVASNNYVYSKLRTLFLTLQTHEGIDGRLQSKVSRFRERLTERFQWDFSHLDREEDDDAPVVVSVT